MTSIAHINVKQIRASGDPRAMPWTVTEVDSGGYLVKCEGAVLETVNGRKPRVFRSLDSVVNALKDELGVTEFKVETLKMDA
jgi:hypothetical protein